MRTCGCVDTNSPVEVSRALGLPRRRRSRIAALLVCAFAVVALWLWVPCVGYAATGSGKVAAMLKSPNLESSARPGALNTLMTGDGKYVYFAEQSVVPKVGPSLRKVSRMRADGSDYSCLYEGVEGDFISGIKVSGDRLVVSMGDNIVSMKTNGSDAHTIVSAAVGYQRGKNFAVSDGRVYYATSSDSGAWEIRSCTVDGSASSVVCSGTSSKDSIGPLVEGAAAGKVVYAIGERQSPHTTLYTVYSAPVDGGSAKKIGESFLGKVAVCGGSVYLMNGGSFQSMFPDGSNKKELCAMPGNGDSRLYNVTDSEAYIGMGSSIWRVSLPSGKTAELEGRRFESGEMDIVGGQVYAHYGIEGSIRKLDESLGVQEDFWRS